jgi:hypothetical protein
MKEYTSEDDKELEYRKLFDEQFNKIHITLRGIADHTNTTLSEFPVYFLERLLERDPVDVLSDYFVDGILKDLIYKKNVMDKLK